MPEFGRLVRRDDHLETGTDLTRTDREIDNDQSQLHVLGVVGQQALLIAITLDPQPLQKWDHQ